MIIKMTKTKAKNFRKKAIALITAISFTFQPVLVSAEVIIDKNASPNQPTVQTAPNGVPIIDIAKPSNNGISHNYYQQFNVDKIGLIFNNSHGISKTQLAGYILGNPNLTNGTARIILNEVTSTNPSYLRGYSEIAGSKAEIIIANPNGIYGDGFGFINANRAILTTGKPIFGGDGSLEAFNVNRGSIQIAGDGLDAKQIDQVDLLSKAVEVNAGIWAKDLNVIAGSNKIDHNTLAAQKIASDQPQEQVAIDVGALGGMYANKIKLIGTDAGVGVNLGGDLLAQNNIEVSSDGNIKLIGNTAAKGDIKLAAQNDIAINGMVNAEKNINLNSQGQINNTSNVIAGTNNTIIAKSLVSTGNIGAGISSDNTLKETGDLSIVTAETATMYGNNIAAGNLTVQGTAIDLSGAKTMSGGNVSLTATAGDINHTGATLQTDGALSIKAANTVDNTGGTITTQQDINMNSASVANDQGTVAAGGNLKINAQNSLSNQQGVVQAGKSLTVTVQIIANQQGSITSLDDSGLTITTAQSVDNTAGTIGGNGDVNLTTASLVNNTGKVLAKKDINANISDSLDNTNGKITAEQDVNIGKTAATSTIKTSQGSMSAGENLLVNAASFNIAGGNLAANNDINLTGNNLFGAGTITSGQDVNVNLNGDFTYGAGTSIAANRDLNFTVANLHNDGSMSAVRNLSVSAASVANGAGATLKGTGLTINATGNVANSGTIQSSDVNLSGNTIINTGAVFGDTLTVTANTVQNNGDKAAIATTKEANLYAKTSLENKDGATIYSTGNINIAGSSKKDSNGEYIDKTNAVLNQSATIEAEKDVNISANTLTNKKREFVTEQKVVSDETYIKVSNSVGIWSSSKNHLFPWNNEYDIGFRNYYRIFFLGKTVTETKIIKDSPEGKIISANNMKLRTNTVTNDNSSILAGGTLSTLGIVDNIAIGNTRITTRHLAEAHELFDKEDTVAVGSIDKFYNDSTYEQLPGGGTAIFGGGQAVTIQGTNINNINSSPINNPTVNSSVPIENTQTLLPVAKDTNTSSAKQTVATQITLPSNAMFKINTEPSAHYLVETDSRFTNYGNFVSSDYMLQTLGVDPAKTAKRLGDGFYEQKLVREQVTELTGRYTLSGYSSAEEQYKALLTNGATYAKEFKLQVGVALTAEQMAKLTSDIVWLVEKEVNGQKVLVPEVYLAPSKNVELKANGAVIAADKVQITASGDVKNAGAIKATESVNIQAVNIDNYGGKIDGGKSTQLTADKNILNIGGTINGDQTNLIAGNDIKNETISLTRTLPFMTQTTVGNIASIKARENLTIKAGQDISNTGAQVTAGKDVTITAGGNFTADSVKEQDRLAIGSLLDDNVSNVVSGIHGGNNVSITSGKDTNLKGAQITAGNDLTVLAGGNMNISAVKDESIHEEKVAIHHGWKKTRTDDETVIGSTLQGGGAVTVKTISKLPDGTTIPDSENRGNITIAGSTIESDKSKVTIAAEKDLTIQEVTEKHEFLVQTHTKHKGFVSSKTTDTMDHSLINEVKGSTISGDQVTVSSGKDLTVQGSNIVGTNDVTLSAIDNISITSAKETGNDEHYSYTKKSGLFSGGGLGFTIGSQSTKTTTNEKTLDEVGSTVGSIKGNVTVTADNKVDSAGTNFVAGEDLNITGKEVTIDNTINTYDSQTKFEFKQTGLSVSLGGGILDTGKSAFNNIDRAGEVKDERLKTLHEYQAYKDLKKIKDAKGNLNSGVAVSVSIGSTKITSEQTEHLETVNTSDISAGGNVNIKATEGDLNLKGTKINAVDITLDAKKDLNIESAENKQQTTNNTSSASASIGTSFGLATGTFGGLSGNFQSSKSNENENVITNAESNINASGTLTLNSGKDTNITGSQVSGDKVVATIGGDLNIASKQDTDNYTANNKSIGLGFSTEKIAGKSLPPKVQGPINKTTTTTNVTGSFSKGETDSTYASVVDQAGIFAGKDGFDIKVGKNTDLKGAVISSDATPDKNKISTDTLTFSDMENRAQYNSSNKGVNYDSKKYSPLDPNYKNQGFTPVANMSVSGDADSTTKSAISPGKIEIRSNPSQDISGLSRDTTNSLNALGKIFDKATVQEKQELANMFGEVAFNAIGDLGLKEDDPNKVALKGIVGGIMSKIAGGSFTSGATSAGFNQLIMKELSKIKDPALLQWASLIIGATVSKLTGGDALTGGSITLSDIRNNFFNHFVQEFVEAKTREVLAKVSELASSGKLDFTDKNTDIIYFEGSPGEKIFAPSWRGMVDRYGQVYISVGGSAGAGVGFGCVGTSILMTSNRSQMSKQDMENYITGISAGISASGFVGGGISLGGSGLVGDLSVGTNAAVNVNVSYTIKIGEINI